MDTKEMTPAGANGGGQDGRATTADTGPEHYNAITVLRASLAAKFPQHAHAAPGADGKYACLKSPPSDPLPGGRLALYPIAPGDNTTRVGVLDFDDHDGDPTWEAMADAARPVVDYLRRTGRHPAVFRSTGGRGIHVWLTWDQPQDAASVRTMLDDALASCGFDEGVNGGVKAGVVEIFPKQSRVPEDGLGNAIALPLAGESVPLHPEDLSELAKPRLLMTEAPLPPAEDRAPIEERSDAPVTFDDELVDSALAAIPADDYHTWIDVLRALKGGAKRAGRSDEGVKAIARKWSATSPQHGDGREFEKKWERGFKREARGEGRSLGTLFWHAKRHGWERPDSVARVMGIRIQESDPPLFLVTVHGSNVEVVMNAGDVCSPQAFQRKVLEKTFMLIDRPKPKELRAMLAQAERIPVDESATQLGRFKQRLEDFFDDHVAEDREKLRLDHCWFDEERNRMWFRWRDLENHFRRNRFYDLADHSAALNFVKALGGWYSKLNVGGSAMNLWWVPREPQPDPKPLKVPDGATQTEEDDAPF